jgi:hypothetical protein
LRTMKKIVKIINYFLVFYLILLYTNIKEKKYFHCPHGVLIR